MGQASWERRIQESKRRAVSCFLVLLLSLVVLSVPTTPSLADTDAAPTMTATEQSSLFWVGLAYLTEDRRASAMVGAVGVLQTSINSAIIGAVFGGPAGFAAGVGYGL